MSKSQSKKGSGGAKKYGRNKIKCENYLRSGRRTANKLKKFIKNNIHRGLSEKECSNRISEFKDLQAGRKNNA